MIKPEDLMSGILPQLQEVLLEHIINKVDNVDVGDQSVVGTSVEAQYKVSGVEGEISITVTPGQIKGTQIVDVPAYNRGGSEVRGHSRTYEDQRVFRLSNGDYITTDTVPDEIMGSIIEEAMGESFGES